MITYGANLGMPHTKAMSGGLFELRISGKNKITRSFYCVLKGKGRDGNKLGIYIILSFFFLL